MMCSTVLCLSFICRYFQSVVSLSELTPHWHLQPAKVKQRPYWDRRNELREVHTMVSIRRTKLLLAAAVAAASVLLIISYPHCSPVVIYLLLLHRLLPIFSMVMLYLSFLFPFLLHWRYQSALAQRGSLVLTTPYKTSSFGDLVVTLSRVLYQGRYVARPRILCGNVTSDIV